MSDLPAHDATPRPEEPPPVLGTWRRLYAVVLLELALLVAIFHLVARWAR